MNIKPIAKRVRFRIVSSGVECTSLDELKEHFEPKSVFSAIQDGRLEKWLKAIGEDKFAIEMAKHLPKDFSNTEQCLEFLSFFITGNVLRRSAYKTHLEYFQELCKIKELKDYVRQMITSDLASKTDVDLLLFAYKKGFVDDAKKAFRKYIKDKTYERHSDLFYVYGKALEKEGDTQTARKYIKKSIQLGNKEAEKYFENNVNINIDKDKLTKIIEKCFDDALNNSKYASATSYSLIEHFKWLFEYYKDSPSVLFSWAQDQFYNKIQTFKNVYSTNEIAVLEFCLHCCESVVSYPEGYHLKTKQGRTDVLLHNEYQFVYTYLLESGIGCRNKTLGRDEASKAYESMDYLPAKNRVKVLAGEVYSSSIKTKTDGEIPMPLTYGQKKYALFIYCYLTNLFNIEGSSL